MFKISNKLISNNYKRFIHTSTTNKIHGYKIIKNNGIVIGNIIKSRDIIREIISIFPAIVGRELKTYTNLVNESRNIAIERIEKEAKLKDSNGIIGLRIVETSDNGCINIIIYGTAVNISPENNIN